MAREVSAAQGELRRFYRFSYPLTLKSDRLLLLHQRRDGDAALQLSPLLYRMSYDYDELLLNYPATQGTEPALHWKSYGSSDLILLTNRPPLDDQIDRPRKCILPSGQPLEEKIFNVLHRYLRRCNRIQIILSDELIRVAPPEVVAKSNIQFRQNGGPWYDKYRGPSNDWQPPDKRRTTAAYMIFEPEAWPGGPALLVVFGIGGAETLGWTYLLRKRFAHLVGESGFVMAELVTPKLPGPPGTLRFVKDWDVKILTGDQPVQLEPRKAA